MGTPGAFVEETAGLKAALASGRFIINIDIVINKMNIRHLPEMLETFIGWGVKEFDLLHIIPFGNAWTEARDHLFYDLPGNLPYLQRAFAYARRPDIHIWLNRFPPPYTEGFEDLIQDPYKLNDEVRGRREEFDRYLSLGKKLSCREPDRCRYCYLQNLCDTLDVVIDAREGPAVEVLRFSGAAPTSGKLPAAARARLAGASLADAERLARAAEPAEIELDLESYAGIEAALGAGDALFGKKLVRAYAASPAELARLLALDASFEVVAYLTRETEPAVRALGARPPARLALAQPNYDLVTPGPRARPRHARLLRLVYLSGARRERARLHPRPRAPPAPAHARRRHARRRRAHRHARLHPALRRRRLLHQGRALRHLLGGRDVPRRPRQLGEGARVRAAVAPRSRGRDRGGVREETADGRAPRRRARRPRARRA